MWRRVNPNPKGRVKPDCVIRAIALATGQTWYDVYDDLYAVGREECSVPSDNTVWGKYLYDMGFEPFLIENSCRECVTVKEFCKRYPYGVYIIGTGNHATCVINGDYWDSWNSGNEVPSYFWRVK